MERCTWATNTTEEMQAYHDDEWGRPVHEEQQLFELLTLESMQAGLSWAIILNKRETLRAAYDAFDYRKIARYDEEKILALLANPGVIRHRLKFKRPSRMRKFFKKFRQNLGPLIATSGTLSISNQSLITGSTQKRFQPPRNYRNRLVER